MKKTTNIERTKKQRIFAMAMAAAMVASMTPVSAMAAEESGENGSGTEAPVSDAPGTPKITVTINSDGSQTTTTESTAVAADGTTIESTETTTTATTTENNEGGGVTTTETSQTEYTETTTSPAPEGGNAEGDGFQEGRTESSETLTEGEESGSDRVITDGKDRIIEESGESGGQEKTTKTETVEENKLEDRDELEEDSYTEGEENLVEEEAVTLGDFSEGENSDDTQEIDPGYAGDIVIELKPGGEGSGSAELDEGKLYEELLKGDRPKEGKTEGTPVVEDVLGEAGEKLGIKTTKKDVETTVSDIINDEDQVVGYESTTTTTKTIVTELEKKNSDVHQPEVSIGEATITEETTESIDLPERPAEGETTDEATGETTKVTVEDIVNENGETVGYEVKKVTVDKGGKEIGWGSQSLFGKKTITVTTKEILETTTTKTEYIIVKETTTDITEGMTTSGKFITSSARYATAGMGKVEEGSGHGVVTLEALGVDEEELKKLLDNTENNDLFDPDDFIDGRTDSGQFIYIGHLVGSDYMVKRGGWRTTPYIYVLEDREGNQFYGYCADVGTSAVKGKLYEISNLEDQNYYQGEDAEEHIRGIITNGFWGKEEGQGSLEAVKQLLKREGYEAWDTLTEGQALAATQAAMWKFGNNGTADAPTEKQVTVANNANAQKLYEILVEKKVSAKEDTSTNVLDAKDITASVITVGEKAAEHTNNTDHDDKNDVYDTKISFTVALIPDRDDSLKAVVYQNGVKVGEKALTAENGVAKEDGSTTYTLENLQLQEGVNINLSLEGTQELKQGVYLYTAIDGVDTSQTFVGMATGSRSVDLDVNLAFEVKDEAAEINSYSSSSSRTGSGRSVTEKVDTEIDQEVIAMVEVTSVTVTEQGRDWEDSYEKHFEYPENPGGGSDDDDPKDPEEPETPEEDENFEEPPTEEYIVDEDVPLAELEIGDEAVPLSDVPEDILLAGVPKTGDVSGIWLALSSLSGIGLAGLLGRKRR